MLFLKIYSKIRNAKAPSNRAKPAPIEDTAYIPQKFAGIRSCQQNSTHNTLIYMGTSGIATCVGLTIWSSKDLKVGLVAHLDSDHANEITSYVNELFQRMMNVDKTLSETDPVEITLTYQTSGVDSLLIENLQKTIETKFTNTNPRHRKTGTPEDLTLDVQTGKVACYREKTENIAEKFSRFDSVKLRHDDKLDLQYFRLKHGQVFQLQPSLDGLQYDKNELYQDVQQYLSTHGELHRDSKVEVVSQESKKSSTTMMLHAMGITQQHSKEITQEQHDSTGKKQSPGGINELDKKQDSHEKEINQSHQETQGLEVASDKQQSSKNANNKEDDQKPLDTSSSPSMRRGR